MLLRQLIASYPKSSAAVAGSLLGICLLFIFLQVKPDSPKGESTAFYTSDDGQTFFSDKADLVVPFDRDGKTVVRAVMASVDNATSHIAYLQRYSPDGRTRIQAALDSIAAASRVEHKGTLALPQVPLGNPELQQVKLPGKGDWVAMTSADGLKVSKLAVVEAK